ncbi:MAG: hypothetical protein JWN44_459 [Myxococcales bacterium]|nr:hypothetical protein [Myxococcales bacterium]
MLTADEVYARVAERLPETLELDGEAATHEVLAAVAARLTADEAAELGAELPTELGDILAEAHGARGFDRDGLLEDLAVRLDVDDDDAESAAATVLRVVREAIEPMVSIDQVLESLPPELAQLMQP